MGIERDDAEAGESIGGFAAVPDDNPTDRVLGFQIDFPPRILGAFRGVGDRALVIGTRRVAVVGAGGGGVGEGGLLRGRALGRHVDALAEDLHFGELEQLVLARQFDSDEADPRFFRAFGWRYFRLDSGDDEVARGVAGAFVRKGLVGKCFEAECGEALSGGRVDLDDVAVLRGRGGDGDGAVRFAGHREAGLGFEDRGHKRLPLE